MRRPVRRGVGLVLPALALVVWGGCRAPTQVTVVLTSPALACGAGAGSLQGATVTVAGDAKTAEERTMTAVTANVPCPAGAHDLGTLVVTPGESDNAAVVVVAGVEVPVDQCSRDGGYKGCIVARRTLSFVEHVRLTVPIALDPSCVSKVCPVNQTCENATCVSSGLDCNESGSCSPASPPDSGAPVPASDAGADGGADGGPIIGADSGPPPLQLCTAACETTTLGPGAPCPAGLVCCTPNVVDKAQSGLGTCTLPTLCAGSFAGGLGDKTALCCADSHDCEGVSPDKPKCCLKVDGSRSFCAKGCEADQYELCNPNAFVPTCSKGTCGELHAKPPQIYACLSANN